MINYENIRNKIVSGLYEYMQTPIVPADQANRKPVYPYVSYKFVSLYIPEPGFKAQDEQLIASPNPDFALDIKQISSDQPNMVLSFTAISKSDIESAGVASEVRDWFSIHGYDFLKEQNIVVVESTTATDRTGLMIDDYERRYGFDVRLRVLDAIENVVEYIETVNAISGDLSQFIDYGDYDGAPITFVDYGNI